jgi:hypothetical protein
MVNAQATAPSGSNFEAALLKLATLHHVQFRRQLLEPAGRCHRVAAYPLRCNGRERIGFCFLVLDTSSPLGGSLRITIAPLCNEVWNRCSLSFCREKFDFVGKAPSGSSLPNCEK